MSLRRLIATYQQITTPVVNLCFATALAAAAVAAVAALVNQFITPWSIATGMLFVSGFYLLLGAGYLVQHRMSAAANEVVSSGPPAPLGMMAESPGASTPCIASSSERKMARV
jgi:hypothetical protein